MPLAAIVVLAGCGGEHLDGTIRISGSSTVQPIVSRIADEFAQQNGLAQIELQDPGTGQGFISFCDGLTDINDASSRIDSAEKAACHQNGVHDQELEIAKDAVVVVQSRGSDGPGCLTLADLYALTGPESGGFQSYSDANLLARQIGPGGSLPNRPFELVTPGTSSGTTQTYVQDVIGGPAAQRDQAAVVRRDRFTAANDQIVAQEVGQIPGALGILGLTAATKQLNQLRLVSVDGGRGCVKPTRSSISSGAYPLSRSLYLYVNLDRAAANPTVQAFVTLLVSRASLATVAAVGAIPLSPKAEAHTAARWSAR